MSNYLKKGERNSTRKHLKQARKKVKQFENSLFVMNYVYHELKNDVSLTLDNLEDKLSSLTSYNFNEFELDLLREDLCKQNK